MPIQQLLCEVKHTALLYIFKMLYFKFFEENGLIRCFLMLSFFSFSFFFFLVVVEGGESGCNRVYSQLLPLIIFHLFILSSRMDERKAKRGSGGGSWMAD